MQQAIAQKYPLSTLAYSDAGEAAGLFRYVGFLEDVEPYHALFIPAATSPHFVQLWRTEAEAVGSNQVQMASVCRALSGEYGWALDSGSMHLKSQPGAVFGSALNPYFTISSVPGVLAPSNQIVGSAFNYLGPPDYASEGFILVRVS